MIKPKGFINTGVRNKGIMWEYLSAVSYRDLKLPISKFRLTKVLDYGIDKANHHCLYIDDIEKTKKTTIDEINAKLYTPEFFTVIRDYYMKPLAEFKYGISKVTLETLSTNDLLKLYDQFFLTAGMTYPPMLLTFLSANLDEFYTNEIKKVTGNNNLDLHTIKSELLTMPRLSFSEKEEIALYNIIKAIKENKRIDRKSVVAKITKDFGWFHMEYAGVPLVESYYQELIENRLDQPGIISPADIKKEILKKQKEFFSKYSDKRLEYITQVMQEFAFILDDSKAATIESRSIIYPVLKEISKRLSIDLAEIYYLTQPELHNIALGQTLNKREVEERKKLRVVLLDEGIIQIISGLQAQQIADKYIFKEEINNTNQIKGLIAFPGYYEGKVCVISSTSDKDKFNTGDVVVTHDGSAELNYFLQRAGAIVSDQGGIISHAAIVARESKIPAILGTKNATKFFKDGDLVEVDAEKGIIRILK